MATSGGLLDSSTLYHDGFQNASPDDKSDFRLTIVISSLTLMMCSTTAVTFRLARSWQKLRRFQLHDVFILLAAICAMVMSGDCVHLTIHGLGSHDYDGTIATNKHVQMSILVINCFYFSCNLFVKLGLLQMYRAFTRSPAASALIYFMEAASVLFWLGSFLATVFECVPLAAVWDYSIKEGRCIDVVVFYHANAAVMIGMDCVLYLMPILLTWNLRLSRQKRVGLIILFGLGFIVVGASCYRLWVIHQVIRKGDLSYNYGRSLFASALENHTAIVISCAPAVRSVISRGLYPRVRDALSTGKGKLKELWTSSAASAPNTPLVAQFRDGGSGGHAFNAVKGRPASAVLPALYPSFFSDSEAKSGMGTQTTASRGYVDSEDIELGFHDTSCEFVPRIETSICAREQSPRPQSSKGKIYVTREIVVTEEFKREGSIKSVVDGLNGTEVVSRENHGEGNTITAHGLGIESSNEKSGDDATEIDEKENMRVVHKEVEKSEVDWPLSSPS